MEVQIRLGDQRRFLLLPESVRRRGPTSARWSFSASLDCAATGRQRSGGNAGAESNIGQECSSYYVFQAEGLHRTPGRRETHQEQGEREGTTTEGDGRKVIKVAEVKEIKKKVK